MDAVPADGSATVPCRISYDLGCECSIVGGVLRKESEGKRRQQGRAKDLLDAKREQVQAYEDLCDELGREPAEVGLAWLLHQPAVTAPIVGPRTVGQLDSAIQARDLELDSATLDRIDGIFPGYRTAPEDYAW